MDYVEKMKKDLEEVDRIMENKKEFIKNWVLQNQGNKTMKEFVKKYGVEEVANMIYDCYLNTNSELNNTSLENLFYINFVGEE